MKTTLGILSLLSVLSCSAQQFVWESSVQLPGVLTNSPVIYPDGAGGGAAVFSTTGNAARIVWFSSTGALNLSSDIPFPASPAGTNLAAVAEAYRRYFQNTSSFSDQNIVFNAMAESFFAANPPPAAGVKVLRVTKKVLDVHITDAQGVSFIVRQPLGKDALTLVLRDFETLGTVPPTSDKRGFFTTLVSSNVVTVRRFAY